MFGLRRKKGGWTPYLWGKHPSFRDFVETGSPGIMAQALRQWMDRSFAASASAMKEQGFSGTCWRFLIRGRGSNDAAFGLVKESSDAIGRPYPLLLVMEGALEGLSGQIVQVLKRLEPAWMAMEQVAAGSYRSGQELARAVEGLKEGLDSQRLFGQGATAAGGEPEFEAACSGIAREISGTMAPRALFLKSSPPPEALLTKGRDEGLFHIARDGIGPRDFDRLFLKDRAERAS